MTTYSRREVLPLLAAGAVLPSLGAAASAPARDFRVRAITAGVPVADASDLAPIESALATLQRAKAAFSEQGYEVQTVRVTLTPFVAGLSARERDRVLPALQAIDALVDSVGAVVSIGPVLRTDGEDPELVHWLSRLLAGTKRISASVTVASPEHGVHTRACSLAASTMLALSSATDGGMGNFRFAASACVPAGTPFFPVGYHEGPPGLAVGLETAGLVERAIAGATSAAQATARLRTALNGALAPIESIGQRVAGAQKLRWIGIDPSPAPGLDRSIGAALEALIGGAFGTASTLLACSAVTAALKELEVRTCGYAGLMLPVLEDPRLAQRAVEGRYGLRDLLLYSSACGTGLDVVPIAGNTAPELLTRVILDVAALSARWQKPLSARLFPVAGKRAGEMTTFDDPLLVNCPVFAVS